MNTIYPPTQPLYSSRRSPVLAQNIVATSHPLAAQAGIQMIAKGGNAIDAAIASAITLTVVEPTGCGLGSDAFAEFGMAKNCMVLMPLASHPPVGPQTGLVIWKKCHFVAGRA